MAALVDLGVISKCTALKAMRLDEINWGESIHRVEIEKQELWVVQPSKFKCKRKNQQRRLGRSGEGGEENKTEQSGVS